ncbi:MAG: cysteine--tRNA ligase [Deltaproteobacteria bacterium]|nr:cysteine--tRNA ligase [Deltaproteobacteria bacterium]
MGLKIFNTLTGRKEDFVPLQEGKVGMYVCGVTVYDLSHIGHARCYVAFDVVYRYLRGSGRSVRYVRNFTDVDDKIINRAAQTGDAPVDLATRNIEAFHRDMDSLGCLHPDVEPRVTDHIPEIIALVERIIGNGHAYAAPDGSVYFSIDSFPQYGQLSKRNLDDMVAGASERVDEDPNKRNPLDFVLWKPAKPGEPWWESPWGRGRPGWHIECSAMSARHLGETFDIHGGGKDLVFPHHENEIAQSRAASGKEFVRYWLHNGFVNVDQEKMSKSLGNFFTIRDVLALYHPEAIRMFLLSTHYRSPINYSARNLDEATGRIEYMIETVGKVEAALADGGPEGGEAAADVARVRGAIGEAMDDDFNTAAALGHLFELCRAANDWVARKRKTPGRIETLSAIRKVLAEAAGIFGILERPPATVLSEIRDRDVARLGLDVVDIERVIAERWAARQAKDFARADALRTELSARNIDLMDSPQGSTWRVRRQAQE